MEKKLWFRRKTYGYGWTPSSWEGWAVTFGYIVLILGLAFALDPDASDREAIVMLVIPMTVFTGLLIRITVDYGEEPRWQWGREKEEEKTDET